LLKAESDGLQASITIRSAHTGDDFVLRADRVINCTGPSRNYAKTDIPLIVGMRDQGSLVPDRLGLGVETDAGGRLIGADGSPAHKLFTIGPLRISSLFESIAIPEIRVQADELAQLLASELRRN
jgi:hydroxyacylglutathione hydrolase